MGVSTRTDFAAALVPEAGRPARPTSSSRRDGSGSTPIRCASPARSNLYGSAQVALDIGIGRHARIVVGASAFDSDQHRTEVVCSPRCLRERVRSLDFFPAVDFIWRR